VAARDVDYDAFSSAVTQAYFPHDLRIQRAGPGLSNTLRSVSLGPVRLARIGWGADVAVESEHPGAWAINVPRSGVLEARIGERRVQSIDGQATVCPPDVRTRMTRWSADCSIVGMRVDREYLASEAAAVTGASARSMPGQLDLRGGAGRAWLALVSSIGTEVLRSPSVVAEPAVARRLGDTLTAALVLACFPEDAARRSLQPRIVTRVLDALTADPARQWSITDLARVAGVSVRRLQQGFREHQGTSPMAALTSIRLARVHADLLAGSAVSVAEAANRWGFTHLGRFAATYRDHYGVPPSHTLRAP